MATTTILPGTNNTTTNTTATSGQKPAPKTITKANEPKTAPVFVPISREEYNNRNKKTGAKFPGVGRGHYPRNSENFDKSKYAFRSFAKDIQDWLTQPFVPGGGSFYNISSANPGNTKEMPKAEELELCRFWTRGTPKKGWIHSYKESVVLLQVKRNFDPEGNCIGGEIVFTTVKYQQQDAQGRLVISKMTSRVQADINRAILGDPEKGIAPLTLVSDEDYKSGGGNGWLVKETDMELSLQKKAKPAPKAETPTVAAVVEQAAEAAPKAETVTEAPATDEPAPVVPEAPTEATAPAEAATN